MKYYVIPVNFKYGEAFRVRIFESEDKLTNFLLNVGNSDKYMIIQGQEIKFSRRTQIVYNPTNEDE